MSRDVELDMRSLTYAVPVFDGDLFLGTLEIDGRGTFAKKVMQDAALALSRARIMDIDWPKGVTFKPRAQ